MVQDFRNDKGNLIRIHILACAARVCNDHFPELTNHPAQKNRYHHNQGAMPTFLYNTKSLLKTCLWKKQHFVIRHKKLTVLYQINGEPV